MAHKHTVRDTGAHFTIDQFTRQIKNDSAEKTTIVQYDHNSERLTFEMPLYVDGHAMTLCNLIELHFINVSNNGDTQNTGTYEVADIKAEGDKAIFTWLISQEATQLVGSLNFLIVFKCVENGVTVYRWSTEIFKNLSVSDGMDNGEAVLTEYPDILAQWKTQLFDASDTAVSNVATAEAKALAAIEEAGEAKKQAVLDSIPDEYETLSALADSNCRNKAGAIVLDAEGESIVLNDASEYPLQNLKLFGKSTQDGTPTPGAPVEIVNPSVSLVSVCRKNLCSVNNESFTQSKRYKLAMPIPAGNYFFSCTASSTDTDEEVCLVGFYHGDNHVRSISIERGKRIMREIQLTDTVDAVQLYASSTHSYGLGDSATFTDIMIAYQECDYEPYIGQTLTTSRTLPGIPVTSGGNYTDANGQQWICDEVDLARGVYVQRVVAIELTGKETWSLNSQAKQEGVNAYHIMLNQSVRHGCGCCTHFANAGSWTDGLHNRNGVFWVANDTVVVFKTDGTQTFDDFNTMIRNVYETGNPVNLYCVRKSPIETPLSDAEITAFKALHSNKPNTTILNDAGAYMAVEYVADTKTYIDNKIKELMEGVTE